MPVARGLDADQLDLGVVDERHEDPDRVGAAADAGDHALGQPARLLEHLRARLVADHALEVAHDRRERRRADARADDVVGVGDVGDPVADRGRHRLLERPRARLDRRDGRAEQAHALDVGLLAAHVLGAHVDDALEAEQRAGGGAGDAVLAGAGLGDDPRLAHALGQQRLAERVVDLVRAGVQQVLALEVDRAAGAPRRAAAPRTAASGGRRSRAAAARGRPGSRRRRAPRPTPPRARRAPASASRGRTGRRRGRSGARPRSCDSRARPPAAISRKRRTFSGSLTPGARSVPEALSTAHGLRGGDRLGDVVGRRARRTGSAAPSSGGRPAGSQSQVRPLPPRMAPAAASSRWKSVRKASSARMSPAVATCAALMTLQPVRRATSAQNAGPSSPCSCRWREADRLGLVRRSRRASG